MEAIPEGHCMAVDDGQVVDARVVNDADEDNQDIAVEAEVARIVDEGDHGDSNAQVGGEVHATNADTGDSETGTVADKGRLCEEDMKVCVAIAGDALPFPFQRKCIDVPVSSGATVEEVVAVVRAQTVCYWDESIVLVFVPKLGSECLTKHQDDLLNVRHIYCGDDDLAVDPSATLKELLGDGIQNCNIVHLVIKLQPLAQLSSIDVAHLAVMKTFGTFKRFHLSSDPQPTKKNSGEIDSLELDCFHLLNRELSSVAAFPRSFYMRAAENVVLSILEEKIRKCENDLPALSLALVGSPGIGKSTLAQILALRVRHYLDALHIQHSRPGLVFFKFFTTGGDLVCGKIDRVAVPLLAVTLARVEGRAINPFVIVDGFQAPPKTSFHMVVTSGAFNASALGQCTVLLPSWSQRDVDTTVKLMGLPTVVSERYLHYGGDLRSILAEDQHASMASLAGAMDRITEDTVALQLSNWIKSTTSVASVY